MPWHVAKSVANEGVALVDLPWHVSTTMSAFPKKLVTLGCCVGRMPCGLIYEWEVGSIAFSLHLIFGDKAETGAVDAVAEAAAVAWAVREYVAEM